MCVRRLTAEPCSGSYCGRLFDRYTVRNVLVCRNKSTLVIGKTRRWHTTIAPITKKPHASSCMRASAAPAVFLQCSAIPALKIRDSRL